jgi:hypothetical protein
VSGSLDGLTPGRREIGRLIVKRLGPGAREGLAPLEAFKDLRRLELDWPEEVDLSPLAGLDLEWLRIEYPQRMELGPLAGLRGVKLLDVYYARDCTVPAEWPLSPSSEHRGLGVERPYGALLRQAVQAIPWSALTSLTRVALSGDGNYVDLGFLAELPGLEGLWVYGLRHRGTGPSPFAPPFPGLPLDLEGGICDVEDHEAVRVAWEEHRRAAGRTAPTMEFRALWAPPRRRSRRRRHGRSRRPRTTAIRGEPTAPSGWPPTVATARPSTTR